MYYSDLHMPKNWSPGASSYKINLINICIIIVKMGYYKCLNNYLAILVSM